MFLHRFNNSIAKRTRGGGGTSCKGAAISTESERERDMQCATCFLDRFFRTTRMSTLLELSRGRPFQLDSNLFPLPLSILPYKVLLCIWDRVDLATVELFLWKKLQTCNWNSTSISTAPVDDVTKMLYILYIGQLLCVRYRMSVDIKTQSRSRLFSQVFLLHSCARVRRQILLHGEREREFHFWLSSFSRKVYQVIDENSSHTTSYSLKIVETQEMV